MLNPTHTLSEAVRISGATEEELRKAIKDGLIRAHFAQNTGEYHVDAEDLRQYMRRSRGAIPAVPPARKRLMVVDDDARFGDQIKLELGRDPRIEIKYSTWSGDGARLAKSYQPHLYLLAVTPASPTSEEVLSVVHDQQAFGKCLVVVYSGRTYVPVAGQPDLDARAREMGADEILSLSSGTRILVIKCFQLLNLDGKTQIIRRHPGA